MSQNNFPKLHNAMWPGLVGKGSPGAEPCLDLDTMLRLTAKAEEAQEPDWEDNGKESGEAAEAGSNDEGSGSTGEAPAGSLGIGSLKGAFR